MICGAVRFDHPAAHNLVGALPRSSTSTARRAGVAVQTTLRLWRRRPASRGRWRGGHHPARRHPRHPGDPRLDRERPRRADRLAGRAARPADRPRARADPRRPRARLDGRGAGRARWRCHARRSRPASPSSSASQRCSTSRAGACSWRARRLRDGAHRRRGRRPARLPLRGRVRPRVQARHRRRPGDRATRRRAGPRLSHHSSATPFRGAPRLGRPHGRGNVVSPLDRPHARQQQRGERDAGRRARRRRSASPARRSLR